MRGCFYDEDVAQQQTPVDRAVEAARKAGRAFAPTGTPGTLAQAMAEVAEEGARAAIESLREAGVLIVRI